MNENKNSFEYTYAADEREEILKIREKYEVSASEHEESDVEKLRRLDSAVKRKASALPIIFGVVGVLLLGLGMSLVMSELGESVPYSAPIGIGIGVIGIALCAVAYPTYSALLKREKRKAAPEIIELADKLMK